MEASSRLTPELPMVRYRGGSPGDEPLLGLPRAQPQLPQPCSQRNSHRIPMRFCSLIYTNSIWAIPREELVKRVKTDPSLLVLCN